MKTHKTPSRHPLTQSASAENFLGSAIFRFFRKVCWLGAALLFLASCGSPDSYQPGKPHHHTPEGFRNPEGSPQRSFSWEALWFFPSRPFAQLFESEVPPGHVVPPDEALADFFEAEGQNSVTWIGHMTAVIRLEGQLILIDPWFSHYASPLPPFGPHRKMPPGLPLAQLPPMDTVVISHNHYDHFDVATLEQLPHPEKITLIVPLKLRQYVENIPFQQVIELDWYESVQHKNVRFTALPVVHFSARGLTDVNETLWAGFSMEGLQNQRKIFYFEGDYGAIYEKLGKDYGPFDLVLIAAGAYSPRSVMAGSHCTPATCVQAGLDLQGDVLVPLHWGTTVLGTENIYETGEEFRQEAQKQGIPPEKVWVMKIGETRRF